MVGNQSDDYRAITGDPVDIIGHYNYWQEQRPASYLTPITTYGFYRPTVEDKGLKALSILKVLIKKKLAKIETIEQFIDIMDELVKIL